MPIKLTNSEKDIKNSMQMHFLNDEFCFAFFILIHPDAEKREIRTQDKIEDELIEYKIVSGTNRIKRLKFTKKIDYSFSVSIGFKESFKAGLKRNISINSNSESFFYEYPANNIVIKPFLNEDYNDVIHFMSNNNANVLYIKDFFAKNVSKLQIEKFFSEQKIKIIYENDVLKMIKQRKLNK